MKKTIIKWEVIITIIISITGLYISYKANEMTKIQTELARSSSLPNIQVERIEVKDDKTGNSYETVIEITNLEGKINNYSSRIVTFLSCNYLDEDLNYYSEEVPIFNYYILGGKSGKKTGLLEQRTTLGNFNTIKQLQNGVIEYNRASGESLSLKINTYLQIVYKDLLNDEQSIYYSIDEFNIEVIDDEDGKKKFDKYDELAKYNYGINPNRESIIQVEELISNIYMISEVDYEGNIEKDKIKKIGEFEGMTEIIAVVIGAILAYWFGLRQEKKKVEIEKSHAASILYYDLKSIEFYLTKERSLVNIRYTADWQSIVAKCFFLSRQQISCIYEIYDKTYNYNCIYSHKEKQGKKVIKEKMPQFNELKKVLFDTSKGYIDVNTYSLIYKEMLVSLDNNIIKNKN